MTRQVTGEKLIALQNKVVEHFTETEWYELATLLDSFDLVNTHHRLLRSYRFADDDYGGWVLQVLKTMINDDPARLARAEKYVNKKTKAKGEMVSSEDSGGKRIVFSPLVFRVPESAVDRGLVSVMMPFEASMQCVFGAIKEAAGDAGFQCLRANDIWEDSTVIQDIFSLIFRSFIVICDFSKRNPNVLYEAGIAHTLGRHVIPITQSGDDVPFDLRHHRYLAYLNNAEGREELRSEICERLKTLASDG